MPRRTDIQRIMVIGSGPIVIGQACEFDYSGTQACKVLRREGFHVVARELEPGHDHDRPGVRRRHVHRAAHARVGAWILERERPDALLPTLGGQTGAQRHRRARRVGRPGPARRPFDRRRARGDPPGRGPQRLPARDAGRRPADPARRHRANARRGRGDRGAGRLPVDRAAVVHARRRRQRVRPRPVAARGARLPQSRAEPDARGARRGVGGRVEGVRARGDARRRGQRRHRVLDRERRPDGRAHRATRSPWRPRRR